MTKEESLNYLIGELNHEKAIDTNLIRDGYHSFGELYEHRITLYIALAKIISEKENTRGEDIPVWKSQLHSDGTSFEGWFVLGIETKKGKQITYHLPIGEWNKTDFAEILAKAPEFDGHASADVLKRISEL